MNTFKPDLCTVSYRPMSIKNKLLMSVSLVVGFSLLDGKLKDEQELWDQAQAFLDGCALDEGLPKAHGEFLVGGSCHAPKGKTLTRGQAHVRVGKIEKRLAVFGDRLWRRGGFGMTEPLEFTSMPLTWERSFGHEFYPHNPLGRGIIPDQKPADAVFLLPNIEYLDKLIVDTSDRPLPAAPLPVPPHWPQRAAKAGTYGEAWLKDRWPWFPDDIDWEYCNVAPGDQHIRGFFKGGEEIAIFGMNPEHQRIRSRVPRLRPRCFATVKKDRKAGAEHDLFREVDMKADTLWLFPDAMLGALVYHGTTRVQDEEFDDVRYFYAALENPDEEPESLEDHFARQWVRAAEVTPNFFGRELNAKETEAVMTALWMRRFKASLERVGRESMREHPVMPFSEARVRAKAANIFKAMRRGYDSSVKEMAAMPPSAELGRWIAKTASMRDKLYIQERRTLRMLDEQLKEQHQALLKMSREMPGTLSPGNLDEMIGAMQKPAPVNPWHDRAFPLVAECRERLELDDGCLAALESLGFDTTIVDEAWLGYLPAPLPQHAADWGLPEGEEDFTIPAGLLLPRFDETTLTRIAVLRGWTPDLTPAGVAALPLYLVPGSEESPLLFAAADEEAPVVLVPGELEAWYLDEQLDGICSVLAFPCAASGPDPAFADKPTGATLELIKKARALIVILPKGPRPKQEDIEPWLALHPDPMLIRLPQIVTLLEAETSEVDVERLVEAHLPPERMGFSLESAAKATDREQEAEAMFNATMNKVALDHLAKAEVGISDPEMAAAAKPHFDKARRKILHPEEFRHERESSNMKVHLRQQKATLRKERERLAHEGLLTPEIDEKFEQGLVGLDKAAVMIDEIRGAFLGKKPGPDAVSQLDNDDMPDMLTREDVILLARRGVSLEGQDVSGLDLSGLDLSGVNFAHASMDETNFSGSDLQGADLSGVSAEKADFSGAKLSDAILEMASFEKSLFTACCFDRAKMNRAELEQCDCRKASFLNAVFFMASLDECDLREAVFDGASFELSSFSGNARGASFQESAHFQTEFSEMELDGCNFARANLNNARFSTCAGRGAVFYEADLDSAMFDECVLPAADFRRARMLHGTISDSEVPKADFTGSILSGSLLENSDFHEANLYGVNGRECLVVKSNLEGADLRGANFMGASFSGSRLVGSNMRMANCFGAEFRLAVMGRTLLEGAILKQTLLEGREDLLS